MGVLCANDSRAMPTRCKNGCEKFGKSPSLKRGVPKVPISGNFRTTSQRKYLPNETGYTYRQQQKTDKYTTKAPYVIP